jgi:holo-[acyl-carrier protein] synthase
VNVIGVGLDLVELAKFEGSLASPSFVQKVFTKVEQEYCTRQKRPHLSYAGKFAVKEAVMKALGAGIYQGVWFAQIEILNSTAGKPYLQLHRKAYEYAAALAVANWHISITHTATTAAAVVLALGR